MSMKNILNNKSVMTGRKSKAAAAACSPPAAKRAHDVAVDVNAFDDIRDAVSLLKRERIISTAVELFHERGVHKTTLEAFAEKMSFTKPIIYSHFASKEALLAEICSRGIRASLDALNHAAATPTYKEEAARKISNLVLSMIKARAMPGLKDSEQVNF